MPQGKGGFLSVEVISRLLEDAILGKIGERDIPRSQQSTSGPSSQIDNAIVGLR